MQSVTQTQEPVEPLDNDMLDEEDLEETAAQDEAGSLLDYSYTRYGVTVNVRTAHWCNACGMHHCLCTNNMCPCS